MPSDDRWHGARSKGRILANRVHAFRAGAPLKSLTTVRPSPPRTFVAARTGVCFAAAIEIGILAAHPGLGLVASLGTFATQYAPRRSTALPVLTLPFIALLLAANTVAGASVAEYRWAAPAVVGGATFAMTCLCSVAEIPPPGTAMFILVCAIGTRLPPGHLGQDFALVLAGGLASSAVVLSERLLLLLPSRRSTIQANSGGEVTRPITGAARSPISRFGPVASRERLRTLVAHRHPSLPRSPTIYMAQRAGGAVLVAGLLANLVGLSRPYWAMFSAASVMAQGSYSTVVTERTLHRFIGTAIGVVIAMLAVSLDPTGPLLAIALGALMFLAALTVTRNYALGLLFITPLALLLTNSVGQAQQVLPLAGQRLLETALGCLAGLVAGYSVSATWAVRQVRLAVSGTVEAMTAQLADGAKDPERLRSLERWTRRLEVVGERAPAERDGVRTAVDPYAGSIAATQQLARRVIEAARPSRDRTEDAPQGSTTQLAKAVSDLTEVLVMERHINPHDD